MSDREIFTFRFVFTKKVLCHTSPTSVRHCSVSGKTITALLVCWEAGEEEQVTTQGWDRDRTGMGQTGLFLQYTILKCSNSIYGFTKVNWDNSGGVCCRPSYSTGYGKKIPWAPESKTSLGNSEWDQVSKQKNKPTK